MLSQTDLSILMELNFDNEIMKLQLVDTALSS